MDCIPVSVVCCSSCEDLTDYLNSLTLLSAPLSTILYLSLLIMQGSPMADLLKWHHATVTTCHSKTKNLPDVVGTVFLCTYTGVLYIMFMVIF